LGAHRHPRRARGRPHQALVLADDAAKLDRPSTKGIMGVYVQ